MKMNDDFIQKALPNVRKDFAQSLYARISDDTTPRFQRGSFLMRRIPRRWQTALIILGLLILVAWSQIRLLIRYVPIGNFWLIEFNSLTQSVPNDQLVRPFVPTPPQLPTAIVEINGTQVILLNTYRSAYLTPEWIPDGFSATRIPGPGYSYEDSIGMWSNVNQETIRLFVVPRAGGARPYAPPGMYEEVHIHEQPAILIFGRLAPNSSENPQAQRQWDKTLGLQLTWTAEDAIYTLETLGPYVSEAELIRMAESMKPTGDITPP